MKTSDATTMEAGKFFVSEELIVAQGDVKDVNKNIESLIIEFNQGACKAYLSGPGSPKATRGYHKISAQSCAHVHASISPDTLLQSANIKVQAYVRGASNVDDGANHTSRHMFLPS